MQDNEVTEVLAEAAALGAEHGKAAASWVFDGNTTTEQYRRFLVGIEEGDPEVLDEYGPRSPLSGEFADDMTPYSLAQELGLDYDSEPTHDMDNICDEYETAYYDAYWQELERVTRLQIGEVL